MTSLEGTISIPQAACTSPRSVQGLALPAWLQMIPTGGDVTIVTRSGHRYLYNAGNGVASILGGASSRMTTVFELTQVDALADAIRGFARRGDGIEEALPIVIRAVGVQRDGVLATLESCRTYLNDNADDVPSLRAVSIMEAISRLAIFNGLVDSDRA